MQPPNLFDFAPSELSQDAFICWLLAWAKPEYESVDNGLYKTAVLLLDSFMAPKKVQYNSIGVEHQLSNIDVFVRINGKEYAIIIEDKTGTGPHGDQLDRYEGEAIKQGYAKDNIVKIYFKTEDQHGYKKEVDAGYKPVLRDKFLTILKQGIQWGVNNPIYLDYYNYLLNIDTTVNSYESTAISTWGPICKKPLIHPYVGLFKELKQWRSDPDDGWGYVPNPAGGFLGFWWHWTPDKTKYLQLENGKLCFQVHEENVSKQTALRNEWYQAIVNANKSLLLPLHNPKRFGKGNYMTVAEIDEYRQVDKSGLIDMVETIKFLEKAESLHNIALQHCG